MVYTNGIPTRIYLNHLSSIVVDWPTTIFAEEVDVPTATMTMDGNFSDWTGVPHAFEDLTRDVYPSDHVDIHRIYIAQDSEAIYFRVIFRRILVPPYCQIRVEVGNYGDPSAIWFTAWIGQDWVQIQRIYADDTPNEILADYIYDSSDPASENFMAVFGNQIEYKVLKADFTDQLDGKCSLAKSVDHEIGDDTFPIRLYTE